MSNRKFAKAMQNLVREVRKFHRRFNRAAVNWLLRSAFVSQRRGQSPLAGFVLPTTVLLVLVLTLTVGAMTLRAFDRNAQVLATAQEKVLYNAATPAIDRARSKLEYLFEKDTRYNRVAGATENQLLAWLTNAPGTYGTGDNAVTLDTSEVRDAPDGGGPDVYTLPDEQRIDIGSADAATFDGESDNSWRYRTDTNGDGTDDATVVYSILLSTPEKIENGKSQPDEELLLTLSDQAKADQRVVRYPPLTRETRLLGCSVEAGSDGTTPAGWFEDPNNPINLLKNFQVDAIVIPDDAKAANVTLEFQQDRQIQRGNKWGAWFRYDLEVFPGPQFNWNGAMHTEGSMFFGNNSRFEAYLVSAPTSCLYRPDSSELSITDRTPPSASDPNAADLGDFEGQAAAGLIGKPDFRGGGAWIHVPPPAGESTSPQRVQLTEDDDSTTEADAVGNIASDPVAIVLEEKTRSLKSGDPTNRGQGAWETKLDERLAQRFKNESTPVPYVDDLYRADNRWGPKPKYDDQADGQVPTTAMVGDEIPTGNRLTLTPTTPTEVEQTGIGLDGYWERRARVEGLRLMVGERLELGNLGGWVTPRDVDRDDYIDPPPRIRSSDYIASRPAKPTYTPAFSANNPPPSLDLSDLVNPQLQTELEGDPLYPPTVAPYPVTGPGVSLPHLNQQRRSLRDNIPAVQAGTVYHSAVGNKDYPVACVAMTAHPGTPNTLRQASNFFPTSFKEDDSNTNTYLLSDFFNGRGTNGWEYEPPSGDVTQFVNDLAAGRPLRIALENLAHFAGDPDGAYPPLQEANRIHPYPALSMWGNFSNLRRALDRLDAVGYDAMSVADKTYLQTAACSLGMLATNIDQLQKFDPTNRNNDGTWNGTTTVMRRLGDNLATLMDGDVDNGEVLPKARLSTYRYDPTRNNFEIDRYNPADYYEVAPEAFVAALKQQVIATGGDYLNDPQIRMAELIMTSHQVRRDRTFGFRPSPAFGEYVVKYDGTRRAFPAACDPDLFALNEPGKISVNPDWSLKEFFLDPGALAGNDLVGGTLAGRRLALSRLCGAIRVPGGYTPGSAVNPNNPAQRPVVQPKFPSLYYIFPEVAHGISGAFVNNPSDDATSSNDVANLPGEWDHRQPGMIGPNRTVADLDPPADTANTNYQTIAANGVNPRDREPFVTDDYINQTDVAGAFTFQPITATALANPRLAAYPTPRPEIAIPPTLSTLNPVAFPAGVTDGSYSRQPYADSSPYPTPDLPVSDIALAPHRIDAFPAGAPAAVLPNYTPRNNANDTSPNRIMIPSSANVATAAVTNLNNLPTQPWAIPFMDKAMFDGRQLQTARVTDVDWGMLRSTKPANQTSGNTKFSPDEPWLPMSGIVYAFREDAIREDGIARPADGPISTLGVTNNQLIGGTAMDVTDLDAPFDPAVQGRGISVKSIDYLPDPDRRVHGFRMRNGTQLKRNPSIIGSIPAVDNVRGLTFVTDQPVYMLGDFNLHQAGDGDETTRGALLEEFTQQLFPDGAGVYNYNQFYNTRTTKEPKFATLNEDRWRPSEILADAISILSDNICDGSLADAFVAPNRSANAVPDFSFGGGNSVPNYPNNIDRRAYDEFGLYSPSCTNNNNTTFQNQNRVSQNPPDNARGWEWKREGADFVSRDDSRPWSDFTTPIQIGRTGEPLLIARPNDANPTLPVNYRIGGLNRNYANPGGGGGRQVSGAVSTRVNAIVVSGLPPSREKQSYGGLHNFPRFLEGWGGDRFFFSGSFLQLNFSNYASGPFEQEAWEPGETPGNGEPIPHYSPPNRLWGYDVALQLAPAGPAASRFVSSANTQSEFYTEPPISDPYINKLCAAAKNAGVTAAKCISQQP